MKLIHAQRSMKYNWHKTRRILRQHGPNHTHTHTERERERDKHTQRERERQTHTQGERERHTHTQTERHTLICQVSICQVYATGSEVQELMCRGIEDQCK